MKLGFYLVGYKGLMFLKKVKIKPEFVVSYGDKNADLENFKKIEQYCNEKEIVFFTKSNFDRFLVSFIDKIFVVGWQYFIKEEMEKMVIFHDSRLPELRGWCPTPTSLINGLDYLGATAFQPTEQIDYGRIYDSQVANISYPIKLKKANDIIVKMYVNMAKKIANGLELGEYPVGNSTYSVWRDREDMFIDWDCTCNEVERKVNALGYPLNGALTKYKGADIRILDIEVLDEHFDMVERHSGKIWSINDNKPIVICGDGIVRIVNACYDKTKDAVSFDKLRVRMGK